MLFKYIYVSHQIEKLQSFLDFIFYAVWCQAPSIDRYDIGLFSSNPELFEVMSGLHYDDSKGSEFFAGHVQRIFGLFAKLTAIEIERLRLWYNANNDVERVCANDPVVSVVRYKELPISHKDLNEEINSFFTNIYKQCLCNPPKILKEKIGDIDDFYDAFTTKNDEAICPFCGYTDLLGPGYSKRDAFDHFLPKVHFPFNSVNLRNLIPACHHCNSSYKAMQDPSSITPDRTKNVVRRKSFYPFAEYRRLSIQVSLSHGYMPALTQEHIEIDFGPKEHSEQIDTWRDVYGVDERYKELICSKNRGRAWVTQALDEWRLRGGQIDEYLEVMTKRINDAPWVDANFLKVPFLNACEQQGLFI